MDKGVAGIPAGIDPADENIWRSYLRYFSTKWSVKPEYLTMLGSVGCYLFDIEVQEWGEQAAYNNSMILPIRNAYYSYCTSTYRMSYFKPHLPLKEPIADFGCGVGFVMRQLQKRGYKDLTGIELPGKQFDIAKEYLHKYDIKMVNDLAGHYETIICMNLLEHMADPMTMVEYLRAHTNRLLANCDLHEQADHIAPMEERHKVIDSLREKGELLNG